MKSQNLKSVLLPLLIFSLNLAGSGFQSLPSVHFFASQKTSSVEMQASVRPNKIDISSVNTYVHPFGTFSYEAPSNWEIKNVDSGVMVYSPQSVIFSASIIRTGYRLSTSSFVALAENTEEFRYGDRDLYDEVYRREDRTKRVILIEKTYSQGGVNKLISTMYRQNDKSVYVVEMQGDRTEIMTNPDYVSLFLAFNDSIQERRVTGVQPRAYAGFWKFTESANQFSLDVPVGWNVQKKQMEKNYTEIQFISPDGNAIIKNIYSKPGEIIQLGSVADYVIKMISESYGSRTDDIKVTSEIVLEDWKSEKITWVSRSGGYAGEAYFEVLNKTQMVIFSMAWNRLFEDIYSPIMDSVVLSYKSDPSFK